MIDNITERLDARRPCKSKQSKCLNSCGRVKRKQLDILWTSAIGDLRIDMLERCRRLRCAELCVRNCVSILRAESGAGQSARATENDNVLRNTN